MHFGFALDSADIDLLNIDLLDTHLDLLDTDIPVNNLFVTKKSSRRLQDMSSIRLQDMSSKSLEDVLSATIFCLPRRLQDVFKMSREMSSRRLRKKSSRRLQDVLKTSWKTKNCYAEDVLKTSSRHVFKTS